jgi:hypothetical protein
MKIQPNTPRDIDGVKSDDELMTTRRGGGEKGKGTMVDGTKKTVRSNA